VCVRAFVLFPSCGVEDLGFETVRMKGRSGDKHASGREGDRGVQLVCITGRWNLADRPTLSIPMLNEIPKIFCPRGPNARAGDR
jgi:hypothetical protein